MKVEYARVSRKDQRLEPQRAAPLADGCERVFEEKVSSREAGRGVSAGSIRQPSTTGEPTDVADGFGNCAARYRPESVGFAVGRRHRSEVS